MDFFKRILGLNGTGAASGDPNGLYFYVQPNGCEEVVRVRIDRNNDLSMSDEGGSYIVRKMVRGVKCRENVEMTLTFNASRALVNIDMKNAKQVDEAAYLAWTEKQNAGSGDL